MDQRGLSSRSQLALAAPIDAQDRQDWVPGRHRGMPANPMTSPILSGSGVVCASRPGRSGPAP